jgi:urease subunit gamma
MWLTPSDQERLLLAVAGMVARDRLDRGVALDVPDATFPDGRKLATLHQPIP